MTAGWSDVGVRRLTPSLRLTAGLVCAAVIGVFVDRGFDLRRIDGSPAYLYAVTGLLAVGIYGSTTGIDLAALRATWRTVALAITVGVLAKAALIAIPMFLLFRSPVYAVLLGVAVAQIDPLAVAALVGESRMSDSAKTILRAWSSFDDPVTMLLAVYLLAFGSVTSTGYAGAVSGNARPLAALGELGWNVVFVFGVLAIRWLCRLAGRNPAVAALARRPLARNCIRIAQVGFLLLVGYVVVAYFLLFGLAVIGLFLRPGTRDQAILDRAARGALILATVALGLVLGNGVRWVGGVLLGATATIAQAVVAPVVARGQSRTDRAYLAFSQQNGITAITLALLLEPFYPGTVAIIGPAVLVVNVIYTASSSVLDLVVGQPHPPTRLLPTDVRRGPRSNAARRCAPAGSDSPVSPAP